MSLWEAKFLGVQGGIKMQELRRIKENETLANSLEPMNRNWESVQSQHSGVTFPQTNLVLGQPCFREDELALYVCASVVDRLWVKVADLKLTYVNKEYVDTMHIDLSRIDNIIDTATNKIKMSLMDTGVKNGQLVRVGDNDKIATSLIDTGVEAGQIPILDNNGKVPLSVLDVGVRGQQIPILDTEGKLVDSTIPNNVARFDESGKLVFPNGAKIWVS